MRCKQSVNLVIALLAIAVVAGASIRLDTENQAPSGVVATIEAAVVTPAISPMAFMLEARELPAQVWIDMTLSP